RMSADLLITGATIVDADGRRPGAIAVKDGRIVDAGDGGAAETIDASGLLLLPGMIDQHIHFMEPTEPDRETFPQGSSAAAVAGVTCLAEHTHSAPVTDPDGLARKAEYLADRSVVDYALVTHATADRPELVAELKGAGSAYMKCFTCTTHGIDGFDP